MKAITLLIALVLLLSVGCTPAPQSGKGFALPVGDSELGKENYVQLQCHACHQIAGIDQMAAEGEEPEMSIKLGGEVTRIHTYGELVTSVINPSHRLAKGYPADSAGEGEPSKMRNYNDVMTVTQLTDLVTFLQSQYSLREYEPPDYPMFYGP